MATRSCETTLVDLLPKIYFHQRDRDDKRDAAITKAAARSFLRGFEPKPALARTLARIRAGELDPGELPTDPADRDSLRKALRRNIMTKEQRRLQSAVATGKVAAEQLPEHGWDGRVVQWSLQANGLTPKQAELLGRRRRGELSREDLARRGIDGLAVRWAFEVDCPTPDQKQLARDIADGKTSLTDLREKDELLYFRIRGKWRQAELELDERALSSRPLLRDGSNKPRPEMWHYVANRVFKHASVKMSDRKLRLLAVASEWGALPGAGRLIVELNRQHEEGVTADLLTDLRREYPDEARALGLPKHTGPPTTADWSPPPGYVRANTVMHNERYFKDGRPIPRQTLHLWTQSDEKKGLVGVVKDPQTREVCVPEPWLLGRIKRYKPRPR